MAFRSGARVAGAAAFWCVLACLSCGTSARACAQGPTTAAIAGQILDEHGRGLAGVEVRVTDRATGMSMRGLSDAEGRYRVSGLQVGGPYSVTARRIGSAPWTRTGFVLTLGQELQVNVTFEPQPVVLEGMESRAAHDRVFSRTHMGAEAFLGDSVIHEMPVINRDLYDLVKLVPQMSTWFALSPSGTGPRVNSIRVDGVSDQVPSSNLAAGQLYGGKVLPLDAVKEYQVLFSPYDVRQGGFAGAGVNVVTKSGTNELHGSLFAYGTTEQLGADVPFVRGSPYEKEQFGASLGGPLVRDRLLFFMATEFQRRLIPAAGPYVEPSGSPQGMLPVSAADIARFQSLLNARNLDGGSSGPVRNPNPSSSVFLRLDAPLSRWNSRVTLRGNYTYADSSIFARPTVLAPTNCPTNACFPLSSLQHSRWVNKRSASVQLVSNLVHGASNELVAGYTALVSGFRPRFKEPLILVMVPGTNGGSAELQSGTHEIATGQRNSSWTTELTDNVSVTAGAHRVTLGASAQLFALAAFQLRGSYGVWEFASLDALESGSPSHYRVTRDTGSITAAHGGYGAVYVGDEWEASSRLSLTVGLRAEVPLLSANPPYVRSVDSTFGLRTDRVPSGELQWSPRLGFNYSLTGRDRATSQLRGGVGLFTGRPPMFWLFGGFSAYGLATRTLQCGSLTGDAGPAPAFRPDYRNPPLACAGGQTFGGATNGEIDVIDPHLRLPQTMRVSLAIDQRLPFGVSGTIEGLYTHTTQGILFSPVNLREPVGLDAHGRSMYGTVSATGVATPNRIASQLGDVISITNLARDRAYDITGELRRDGRVAGVTASLSFGHARDVQSSRPVSASLTDNWRLSRPVSGRETDRALGTSDFDQPVRLHASATLHSPWKRLATDLAFFYIGGSGFPFTYVAGGAGGRGDLNADGAAGNDPIYVPRSALDTAEIRFAGSPSEVATQQAAFDHFIDGAACLAKQRGRIMSRNSCRTPWMHLTNLAIRQTLPGMRTHSLALELQLFNVLNLLNPRWGREQTPPGAILSSSSQIPLVTQVGETSGSQGQPIFRFDPATRRYSFDNVDSYYQIQLAARYNF